MKTTGKPVKYRSCWYSTRSAPHNVGSAFRTADAFRCAGICLCGITATPPNREIHKTALGAEESVDWKHFTDTPAALLELKQQGYTILAIEQTSSSVPLQNFLAPPDQKLALVFGHELDGVSNEALSLCDSAIEVPQHGTKHSLNVAVCVGWCCGSWQAVDYRSMGSSQLTAHSTVSYTVSPLLTHTVSHCFSLISVSVRNSVSEQCKKPR